MATKCKQLDVGNEAELKIGEFFRSKGYWAHIFGKKITGQPVDIIAARENDVWLVDAKHLRKQETSFDFERIEANQRDTLGYAKYFAKIKNLGFCIYSEKFPKTIFYLSYDKLIELEEKGRKSVKFEEMEDLGCILK